MVKVNQKDFVEIEYTGKIKDGNIIFDTTDEATAKENNIYNKEMSYGPVIVCIGEQQLLAGLEKEIEGKETEKSYTIGLSPENAFGKKNAKLVQLISTSKFKQQNVVPMPGLQINIDGLFGIVKTVSGGRTLVDFNHPLSGKALVYDVKINKLITDDKEKLKSYLKLQLNLKDIELELINDEAKIKLKKELPKELKEELNKKVTELIPSVKKLQFVIQEK